MAKPNNTFEVRAKLDLKNIRDHALLGTPATLRAAVQSHRDLLSDKDYKQSDEYMFMHEVDTSSPDLILRSMARKRLIGA